MGNKTSKGGRGRGGSDASLSSGGASASGAAAGSARSRGSDGGSARRGEAGSGAARRRSGSSGQGSARRGSGGAAPEEPATYSPQQMAGLLQMNNGIHQICLGISPQPARERAQGAAEYFAMTWPSKGAVRVTQFTFQLQGNEEKVDIVRGLAQYITFELSWRPEAHGSAAAGRLPEAPPAGADLLLVRCSKFRQLAAADDTENEIPGIPDKQFMVTRDGRFLGLLNGGELTEFTLGAVVGVQKQNIPERDRDDFDRMMAEQKAKILRSVEEDVRVMWTTLVEMWTYQSTDPSDPVFKVEQEHAGRRCVNLEKLWEPEEADIQARAQHFVDTMFRSLAVTEDERRRMEVALLKTKNSQYYECLFERDGLRPHIADYRKVAESCVRVGPIETEQMNYHGERWILHWDDLPSMHDPQYVAAQWQAYVSTGNGVYQRMCEALGLPDPLGDEEAEEEEE